MDQVKLLNFADYFFNTTQGNINELKKELSEAGISLEGKQEKIMEVLRQKRAEMLLETGRKFKENYLKLKSESTENKQNYSVNGLALAYRKKNTDDDEATKMEAKILDLVKKAKEESKM